MLPPAVLMAASRPALLITVATRVFLASDFSASISSAAMAMMSSPSIKLPFSSQSNTRSASPSCAMPMCAPCSTTFWHMASGCIEPQFSVDVFAVGLVAIDDDFRAQFAQHAGRRFVSRAVAAVQNDFHAFERQALRKGRIWQIRCSGPARRQCARPCRCARRSDGCFPFRRRKRAVRFRPSILSSSL